MAACGKPRSIRAKSKSRSIAGSSARREGHSRSRQGDRNLSFQRCRQRSLPFRLEYFLRLVSRTRQAALARRGRPAKDETRAATAFVLEEIIKFLHPFMPFMTEELWAITATDELPRASLLALAKWPDLEGCENPAAEAEIGFIVELVSEIRSVRAEMNVPPAAQLPLVLVGARRRPNRVRKIGMKPLNVWHGCRRFPSRPRLRKNPCR